MSNLSFSNRHLKRLLIANKMSLCLLSLPILLLYIFSPMIFQYNNNNNNNNDSNSSSRSSSSSSIANSSDKENTRETRLDPKNSKIRWCMLTKEDAVKAEVSKWFSTLEHFPHSLEWYASCWTWLQEETQFSGPNVRGGFLMDENAYKKLQVKYWNRAFLPGTLDSCRWETISRFGFMRPFSNILMTRYLLHSFSWYIITSNYCFVGIHSDGLFYLDLQ
jgi:hypothetical protein